MGSSCLCALTFQQVVQVAVVEAAIKQASVVHRSRLSLFAIKQKM